MRLIGEAIRNLFRGVFTRRYPKERPEIPDDFRGKVIHFPERCIYCGLCAKYCPSGAIQVDIKNKRWSYNWGRCLFCQQCEETCHNLPKKDAIRLTKVYEMAGPERKKFTYSDKGK